MQKRLLIISAPSGAGKTTIAGRLMSVFPQLTFSVSATTRSRRPGEVDGTHYYFLTHDEFKQRIAAGDLVEYEEIYGNYYGTLRSEIQTALDAGRTLIFDVDVKGALSLKQQFPDQCLLVFIAPPSLEVLHERLAGRKTEDEAQLARRMDRAREEMDYRSRFDIVIVNDDLERAVGELVGKLGTLLAAE